VRLITKFHMVTRMGRGLLLGGRPPNNKPRPICYHVKFDDQPRTPHLKGTGYQTPSAPFCFGFSALFLHWKQFLNIFLQDKGFPIVFSIRNSFLFLLQILPVTAIMIYVFFTTRCYASARSLLSLGVCPSVSVCHVHALYPDA